MKLEDKLLDRVDVLADKLNHVSSHLWDSMVKYEVTTGIIALLMSLVTMSLTIIFTKWYFKEKAKGVTGGFYTVFRYSTEPTETGLYLASTLILSILSIISFFALTLAVPSAVLHIISPEIYAVRDIIRELK